MKFSTGFRCLENLDFGPLGFQSRKWILMGYWLFGWPKWCLESVSNAIRCFLVLKTLEMYSQVFKIQVFQTSDCLLLLLPRSRGNKFDRFSICGLGISDFGSGKHKILWIREHHSLKRERCDEIDQFIRVPELEMKASPKQRARNHYLSFLFCFKLSSLS